MQNIKKKISAAILGGILALSALLLCACKGVIAAEEAGVTVENARIIPFSMYSRKMAPSAALT